MHVLDPAQLLGPYGLRSVSRRHAEHPFVPKLEDREFMLDHEPAESTSAMFGGNSNWRGPVWFPLNYLLIEALQKHDYFLGNTLQVPCGEQGAPASLWHVWRPTCRSG
jgi:glycogen debranching enzyme